MSGRISEFVMTLKMGKRKPGRSSDIVVKVDSSAEDPKATGGLVSNCIHPWVNKTKAAHVSEVLSSCLRWTPFFEKQGPNVNRVCTRGLVKK